ncbi:recombinase family protein [Candidatus Saccharibacteria bacterium]|nr:recombinase family protein [Candidatus Saccharibacteria bacterium]
MMENNTKRAVAYVRISSLRQVDNESPDTQKEKIQQYADANNIEVAEWFYDEAKSGKNTDREQLQNLLAFALKHVNKIDYVIVYKMNRASRDLDSYVNNVKLVLKSRGITVRSATEPVDDTKMGRFMENLFVILGQLDNDGKAESTVDNMTALAEQGYWQHPPVLGYDSVKIPNASGKLRPSMQPNALADKVKLILERFSEGDITKAALTRFAIESGLRSRNGNKLSEDSINRLLKSAEHAGYIHDKFTNYELVEGKHPPLISKTTYEQNQALLYSRNSHKGQAHLKANLDYSLKGLLLCSNCNKPMYASAPKTGSGGHSPRYHCSRATCKGKTSSIGAKVAEEDYIKLLKQVKPTDGILKLYKSILIKEANHELSGLNKKVSNLRNELNNISETRASTIRKFVEDKITTNDKSELIDDLDKRKLEQSSLLKELEEQQSVREADIESAINFMEQVDKQWVVSEFDIQQRFQKMMFPDGLVYDSKTREFGTTNISPMYRYIPNKKDTSVSLKSNLVDLVHSNWNVILSELNRWKQLLPDSTGLAYSA